MSEPSLQLQKMIHGRLIAAPSVTALVPATNIFDRNTRPEAFPCIIIGEAVSAYADNNDAFYDRVFSDLHIWSQSNDLTLAQSIAGAVRVVLATEPWIVDGYRCSNVRFPNSRLLRDPDGIHSRCILTVEALLQATS